MCFSLYKCVPPSPSLQLLHLADSVRLHGMPVLSSTDTYEKGHIVVKSVWETAAPIQTAVRCIARLRRVVDKSLYDLVLPEDVPNTPASDVQAGVVTPVGKAVPLNSDCGMGTHTPPGGVALTVPVSPVHAGILPRIVGPKDKFLELLASKIPGFDVRTATCFDAADVPYCDVSGDWGRGSFRIHGVIRRREAQRDLTHSSELMYDSDVPKVCDAMCVVREAVSD